MCATYRACTAVARGSPLKVCCVVPARLHRPCTPAARLQRRTGRSLRHPSCSSAAAMMTEPRRMTTAAARWVRRAGAAGAAIALLSNVAMAASSSSHGKSNNGGCINAATADKKVCLASASTADCQAEYDTSFASCFAPGKGVACAASCLAKKAKCTTTKTSGSSTSRTTCVSDCHKQWINAGAQCGGANQACLAAARAAYDTCAAGCTNVPGSCGAALSACLAKCANL